MQIYPTGGGAHNWAPMPYNPATGLVYLPASYAGRPSWTRLRGSRHTGRASHHRAGTHTWTARRFGSVGSGESEVGLASTRRRSGRRGGTVTTASNLVFQVAGDGRLMAYSADKGEKFLEIRSNRTGAGPPITYAVDGKQYVAFMAGAGRPAQTVGPTDAKVDNPPMLFVFELGGTAALPPPPVVAPKPPAPKPATAPPAAPAQDLHN